MQSFGVLKQVVRTLTTRLQRVNLRHLLSICVSILSTLILHVDRLCPIIDFMIFSSFIICLFSIDFYFDILILWTLAVK
jgi:hypothetical protein